MYEHPAPTLGAVCPLSYLSDFQVAWTTPPKHIGCPVWEPPHREFDIGYSGHFGSWVPKLENTLLLYLSLAEEIHGFQML